MLPANATDTAVPEVAVVETDSAATPLRFVVAAPTLVVPIVKATETPEIPAPATDEVSVAVKFAVPELRVPETLPRVVTAFATVRSPEATLVLF